MAKTLTLDQLYNSPESAVPGKTLKLEELYPETVEEQLSVAAGPVSQPGSTGAVSRIEPTDEPFENETQLMGIGGQLNVAPTPDRQATPEAKPQPYEPTRFDTLRAYARRDVQTDPLVSPLEHFRGWAAENNMAKMDQAEQSEYVKAYAVEAIAWAVGQKKLSGDKPTAEYGGQATFDRAEAIMAAAPAELVDAVRADMQAGAGRQRQQDRADYLGNLSAIWDKVLPENPWLRDLTAGYLEAVMDLTSLAARVTGNEEAAMLPMAESIEQGAILGEGQQSTQWLHRGIRGSTRTLTIAAPAAYFGGPYAAIATAATIRGNQAISEGKRAGLTGADLSQYVARAAAIEGGIAGIFQVLGVGGLETALSKQASVTFGAALKQMGVATIQEIPEELLTEALDATNQQLSGVDKSALSPEQLAQTMLDTLVQTLISVGAGSSPRVAGTLVPSNVGPQKASLTSEQVGRAKQIALQLQNEYGVDAKTASAEAFAGVVAADAQAAGQAEAEPIVLKGDELGPAETTGDYRKAARKYAMENLQGHEYVNRQTGRKILVSRKGIHHSSGVNRKAAEFVAVTALPQLIENSTLVETRKPKQSDKQKNLKSVDIFESPIEVGDQAYMARIFVKEFDVSGYTTYEVDSINVYYHHTLHNTEGPAAIGLESAQGGNVSLVSAEPSSNSIGPESQEVKSNSENVSPSAVMPQWDKIPDARELDDKSGPINQLLDTWHARRDLEIARAHIDTLNFQQEIRDYVAQQRKQGSDITYEDTVLAMLLYADLQNATLEGRSDEQTKHNDKLSAEQKAAIDRSQNLSPEELAIANRILAANQAAGKAAREAGIRINLKESYAARLWKPEKEGGGGLRASFRKSTPRARHRTLDSIAHGWAEGKQLQVPDIALSHLVARQQTAQAVEDRNLMLAAEKAGLISPGRPEGFVPIEHPNFTKMQAIGHAEEGKTYGREVFINDDGTIFHRQQMTAEPELAKKLNNILGDSALRGIPVIDSITRWNSTLKHTILTTSLYHHQAFLRSYMLASHGVNPAKGYMDGKKAMLAFTPEVQQLIAGGLTTGSEMQQNWQKWAEEDRTLVGKVIDRVPGAREVKAKLLALRDQQSNFLFNKLGTYLKVNAGILEYRSLLKKHAKALEAGEITTHEIAKIAANIINDDFGGLHLGRKGRNPTVQHVMQLLLLAPDWTESNVASMVKAFKAGREGAAYRQMWGRIVVKAGLMTVLANYLLAAADDDDFVERYKKAWETGHLRWLDIDITPIHRKIMGESDSRAYFSLIGHFRDPIKFVAGETDPDSGWLDPVASLTTAAKHKGSVLSRLAADFGTGTDWRGRRFSTLDELTGGKESRWLDEKSEFQFGQLTGGAAIGNTKLNADQLPSYLMYEARSVMPIPVQSGLAAFVSGEMDAFEAMAKGLGLMVAVEEPRNKGLFKPIKDLK